ncbi:hypothetical protein CLAFUW4_04868 [Fulvia fulva]|uniref:Uncharacterized protein n=1 Tax=Passalora fulva TaxID=5499 RepID=A0A9Q8UUA8_PASFU|nr:uncharacterized protein CLAFUR5_12037 [Fulvia fulva]KAK4626283.1 hypothetical protein CLAFUR4_04854 [Fulvia fulva]KAK4628406.1 hypothetical protein CLAFUR0_04858 [Fulvia fulva]UJO22705.1 hypothetical protein CLAFUR5_12037 [Fulvia fulva]WPV14035.1 hypothetical protein CLAFUW4_04868 [Fulvia fulva]WPV28952.1 hypothetical protein CLAFUW7_04862 [Fulvia fulva]
MFVSDLEYDSDGLMISAMSMLLDAVASTKFPVYELVVQDNAPVALAGRCLRRSQQDDRRASFEKLASLTLRLETSDDLEDEEDEDEYEEDSRDEDEEMEDEYKPWLTTLSKALGITSSLRTIDLNLGYGGKYNEDHVNPNLGAYLRNNRLETIALTGGLFTLHALKALLEPHKNTLRTLKLSFVALDTTDDWRRMFRWIAQTMNIDCLTLWGADTGMSWSLYMTEDSYKATTGSATIHQHLMDLAQNAVFEGNEY